MNIAIIDQLAYIPRFYSELESYKLTSAGCFMERWWKYQPARRDLPERQTSSRIQEEENDRTGLRRSPSKPDIQDTSGMQNLLAKRINSHIQKVKMWNILNVC